MSYWGKWMNEWVGWESGWGVGSTPGRGYNSWDRLKWGEAWQLRAKEGCSREGEGEPDEVRKPGWGPGRGFARQYKNFESYFRTNVSHWEVCIKGWGWCPFLCVLVTQSCLTLCDPADCSPPGPSVHGILQVRIPEWVAMPFSRGSSWPKDRTQVSCIASRFFTIWATRKAHFSL